ncbi:MAG: hypothetical protein ABSH49_05380 [Bryobacteraceae bacterium]|jgi:cytochrome c-type biogenesis protein CcmH/NrfG/MinD-like ATPase involved in chromosome partitioning or flagellar assembly
MPFPYIFTFYSFKGGVGRSLAVMNVAYTLAGRGRHVLVVDMDLEAPGLSGFLTRSGELAEPLAAHPKDILTLLSEAIGAVRTGGSRQERAKQLPPVSNYIRAVSGAKLGPLRPSLGQLGRLDVLWTDLVRDYWTRLAELGLPDLSQEELIGLSSLLHHYFKDQVFPHRPLGIEDFEAPLDTHYDYVLVDSRTGSTEIGGLCVGPLADRLVVLTGLNDQNVEGTLAFLKEAGIQPAPRSKDGEPWDDADAVRAGGEGDPSLGPKPTIVVGTPVPAGEIEYKRKRQGELEKRIGVRPFFLSYHPQMALMESVFVRDYPEEYLSGEYRGLATRVMVQIADDPQRLAAQVTSALMDSGDLRSAIQPLLRLAPHEPELTLGLVGALQQAGSSRLGGAAATELRQLHAALSQHPDTRLAALNNWGIALSDWAKAKEGEEADRLFAAAGAKYAEAFRQKPDDPQVLYNWGIALSDQAKTKKGGEADRLFAAARDKYAEALRLRPDYPNALNNWGATLSDQAKTRKGEEADSLFAEACTKYAEALRLKPGFPEALDNWGAALSDQAKTWKGEEADSLFAEACTKHAEALRLKPDFPEALNNWGNALSGQAKTKNGAEADRLFAAARDKYAEALRLKPDFPEALNNWGAALLDRARTKAGEEADRLLAAASDKYAEALRLKPHFPEALNNWGMALSDQAKTKEGEEADSLFAGAGTKYTEALRIKPDYPSALSNWGNALSDQAKTKDGGEADRLFAAASDKYAEALRLGSDFPGALNNWGAALSDQAKTKNGEEADRLFDEAEGKYAEALRLKPDYSGALNNWGTTLLERAAVKTGEETGRLLQRARQKSLDAERVRPGSGAYNLACVEAREGKAKEAVHWLESLPSDARPTRAKIAADRDFDRIRREPELVSFLESLDGEQAPAGDPTAL